MYPSTFEEHISLLNRVLDRLIYANLSINFKKCQFFRQELKYLGYVVDAHGLHTDPEKVKCILDFPTPSSPKMVKSFLGMAGWYRRFIRNFSCIAAPLSRLTSTRKGAPAFAWNPEAEESFQKLKSALISSPILACPDFSKPFALHCDASLYGLGGMLAQTVDGVEHPIAFTSRTLLPAETRYSATEREALSVIHAVEHFRGYLEGGPKVKIFTDHASLRWFLSLKNPTGRLARWGIRLSVFDFEIIHKKGVENVVPDALSRLLPVAAVSVVADPWYNDLFDAVSGNPAAYPNYQIKGSELYRYSRSKYQLTSCYDWKLVVPLPLREKLIQENHASDLAMHCGVFKTHRRLCLRYFWPNLHGDVVKFVAKCETCQQYKHPNMSPLGHLGNPKSCAFPFQMVSVDLLGPYPMTRDRNIHILSSHVLF